MSLLITRIGNLALLLLATVWCAKDAGYDSASTLLALLCSMLVLEIKEFTDSKALHRKLAEYESAAPKPCEADAVLFKKYLNHFDTTPNIIGFLQDHDFANPFPMSYSEALCRYADEWSGPKVEFVDHKMELARLEFDQAIRLFVKELVVTTFSHRIRTDYFTMDYDQVRTRPELEETRKRLNALSVDAAKLFEAFHRLGKWTFKSA